MKSEVTEAVINQFGAVEQIQSVPAGAVLFEEGQQPRGLFVIHRGSIDLVFSGRKGLSKSLRTSKPGEIVGLSYAVSDMPYDCTARTRTAARIGFVPLSELRRMLEQTPSLWLTVVQFLSADLDSSWASMRALSASHR